MNQLVDTNTICRTQEEILFNWEHWKSIILTQTTVEERRGKMAPGKKPTDADKSNVKKKTVTKKPFEAAKKIPAKKIAVEKSSPKRTPARGLLKEMTKISSGESTSANLASAAKSQRVEENSGSASLSMASSSSSMGMPTSLDLATFVEKAPSKRTPARGLLKEMTKKTLAKKSTVLKSGRKVEATTKKMGSKMMSAKMTAGQKKMPAKKATSLKKGNKKEALTKKISNKMNSAKATSGQKKETKRTAGMKNPVIVIKSVDVSPSSSEKEKKIPKEVEEKEMSVEISSGEPISANDDAASQGSAAKSQMASSSSSMSMPTSFDLAAFVESRLGAINSPSVSQVGIWSEYS